MLHDMFIRFKLWIHSLVNPHCRHCEQVRIELAEIQNQQFDWYKHQIELMRAENKRLLDAILASQDKARESDEVDMSDYKALNVIETWNQRRVRLEKEDRERAKRLTEEAGRALNKNIDELEKELGVS